MLASPVYFDGLSGQFKSFFDRLCHLSTDRKGLVKQLKGRRAAGIFLTYEDKPRDDYAQLGKVIRGYLNWMGDFQDVALMPVADVGPSRPVTDKPDVLEQARGIGRRLAGCVAR